MWLARVLVKSDMKIKLLSTNFLPVLWYIVFGFSKCSLEIVRNCTKPHNSFTVGRHKQHGFFTLKGVMKSFPFKKFQTIVLKRSLCPLRWLLLTFLWRQTPWVQWFGGFKLGSYPRPPSTVKASFSWIRNQAVPSGRHLWIRCMVLSSCDRGAVSACFQR